MQRGVERKACSAVQSLSAVQEGGAPPQVTADSSAAEQASTSAAHITATAGQPGGLPAGWFQAVDPTYNHPYWYNPSTGERTWERPKVSLSRRPSLQSAVKSCSRAEGWCVRWTQRSAASFGVSTTEITSGMLVTLQINLQTVSACPGQQPEGGSGRASSCGNVPSLRVRILRVFELKSRRDAPRTVCPLSRRRRHS